MRSLFIFFFFASLSFADVKSTTGQIKFDTQSDNQAEMTLNITGLGIGIFPSTNLHVNGNVVVSNQLFVGGTSGSSNLNLNGTLGYGFQTVSSNTTLGNFTIILADSSSDNITLTLPYAGNVSGREYQIKKVSTSNSVWVSGVGNLIDDTNVIELPESSDLASVKLISNGIQWYKIFQKDISETVASGNLVGWWKLDESNGNTVSDSSGRSNNGFLNGSSTFSTNGSTGQIGNSLNFDGSDDYIEIQDSDSLDVASGNFAITFWLYADTYTFFNTIFEKSNDADGSREFGFWINSSTDGWLAVGNGGSAWAGTGFVTGQWNHVVLNRVSEDVVDVYLNGALNFTHNNATQTFTSGTGSFRIAADHPLGDNNYFDGKIDDVRIFNKSLSISEIEVIYNQ